MAIEDTIKSIQALLRLETDIGQAPDVPPDKIASVMPFLVCYVGGGVWQTNTSEDVRDMASIIVELHLAYKSLPIAVNRALAFHTSIPARLFKARRDFEITGIDTFGEIAYTFGGLGWENTNPPDTFGYRWTISEVKTRVNL